MTSYLWNAWKPLGKDRENGFQWQLEFLGSCVGIYHTVSKLAMNFYFAGLEKYFFTWHRTGYVKKKKKKSNQWFKKEDQIVEGEASRRNMQCVYRDSDLSLTVF